MLLSRLATLPRPAQQKPQERRTYSQTVRSEPAQRLQGQCERTTKGAGK